MTQDRHTPAPAGRPGRTPGPTAAGRCDEIIRLIDDVLAEVARGLAPRPLVQRGLAPRPALALDPARPGSRPRYGS